jgi:uncharacterized protein YoxC
MSTELAKKQEETLQIIQRQLDNQRNQVETIKSILNEVIQIRDDVNSSKREVNKRFVVMEEMVQEVRDSVTLIYAEEKELQSEVCSRSAALAKDRYKENDKSFSGVVGKYRRLIWSKLKQKFNVPRYNCIRRVDFQDAVEIVRNFSPEDYL